MFLIDASLISLSRNLKNKKDVKNKETMNNITNKDTMKNVEKLNILPGYQIIGIFQESNGWDVSAQGHLSYWQASTVAWSFS